MMHSIAFRVRYSETDAMGYVHHSNYFRYFEMGRTELMRKMGLSYREFEEKGYRLPVIETYCKYIKPAYYDDFLELETRVGFIKRASMKFEYILVRKEDGEKIAESYTLHACTDEKGRVVKIPDFFFERTGLNKSQFM